MVEIRLAIPEESAIISGILGEAFAEFKTDYTPDAFVVVTPPADEVAGRFDEGPIWVAVNEGEIVGTVSVIPEPEWLYIRSMAVLPKAQGLGVGQKLLVAVEEYGIEKGFNKLFLYTTPFSSAAIRLYEKYGFRLDRYTTADEWFGTPGFSMEKIIGKEHKNAIGS
jgi:ribosomal protein S18 acetylase RimI-like enzyme